MATKLKTTPPEKIKTLEAFQSYLRLSSLLFDRRNDEIYNVTDIPENNEFHQIAKQKAEQLKINWDKMTHAQSNRVMLAVLEDSFNNIREIEESDSIILKLNLVINERKAG